MFRLAAVALACLTLLPSSRGIKRDANFDPQTHCATDPPWEAGTDGKPFKGSEILNNAHAKTSHKNPESAADLVSYWGQKIAFRDLVSYGALVKSSNGTYGQARGFTMARDNCSDTPYLYNTAQTTVVTYDDTWSLGDKAKLVKSSNMGGCMTWSIDQDDDSTLQNAIYNVLKS